MIEPADWGAEVRSYQKPYEPEMIWYIEPKHARMTLGEQLLLVVNTAKVMADIAWLESGGILLIVWATAELNALEEALWIIADLCGIPIVTLAN